MKGRPSGKDALDRKKVSWARKFESSIGRAGVRTLLGGVRMEES